jgi:ATP-dependent Clp protease ATP-binding subunit ClpA
MFERFTERARNVVVTAQEAGRALGHTQIGGEHILLGILTQPESVGAKVLMLLGVDEAAVRAEVTSLGGSDAAALRAIGIDLEQVRRRAEEAFGPGALDRPVGKRVGRLFRRGYVRHDASGHLPFGNDAKVLLARSLREALELRHNYIGTEHMLLALTANGRGAAAAVLRRLGMAASHEEIKARVLAELKPAA